MKTKSLLLALILTAFLATWAWADGGFYGYVKYHGCTCTYDDWVCVRLASGGNCQHPWTYYVQRCYASPGYTTSPDTFPPGTYYVYVVKHEGSDCDHVFISGVYHGTADQEVNLDVWGPSGNPTGPPPGP